MRLGRLARVVPVGAMLLALAVPSPVTADHCGAAATIAPISGPPGTTFVFRTNLGAPSDLRVYRNGLVKEAFLEGDGDVRYDIATASRDAGQWRARAEVRGQTDCAAEAAFTVLGTPNTSAANAPPSSPGFSLLITIAAGVAAFGLALRRRAGTARGLH
jgi:hypothetical protein